MVWVLRTAAFVTLLAPSAGWAAARTCQPPPLDVAQLYGKNPREVRSELAPLLGAPLMETNQLPDGGTFAKLESADLTDGVTQRFGWGTHSQGSVEIIYQRGKAQLVSFRLEEFETIVQGSLTPPCALWPRDALAQRVGLFALPKRTSAARTRHLVSNRYDVRLPGKPTWTVRMRCQNDYCADVNVYFPGEGEMLPKEEPTFTSVAPPATIAVPTKSTPAKKSRRPLKTRR